MEIKIFGKSLFKMSKKGDLLTAITSQDKGVDEQKHLPDFYNEGRAIDSNSYDEVITLRELSIRNKKQQSQKQKDSKKITPKEVYDLKLLNDKKFELKTNPEYINKQIYNFKEKLNMIKSEDWDVRRAVDEVKSILVRFENRKKYDKNFDDFYSQFPYTTTTRITKLIKKHDHLTAGKVAQFVPDMPQDAIDVMKEYDKMTKMLCNKQAVYYIIADKKDFKKTNDRRDPILLAQSPLGHFWQILGAWDEEMLFLEEL